MFEDHFNLSSPDLWLRDFHLNFYRWLDTNRMSDREIMLIELATAMLPNWLELHIKNLNCQSFGDLTEAIVRHVGNSRVQKEKEQYRKGTPRKEVRRGSERRNQDGKRNNYHYQGGEMGL